MYKKWKVQKAEARNATDKVTNFNRDCKWEPRLEEKASDTLCTRSKQAGSSVINLSKTYGKITRPPDTGASNIHALLQVVERLEKYPDRRLRFLRAHSRDSKRATNSLGT